jgi:hypothetical protein
LDHQEKQIGQACNDLNQVYQKILAILQNQINAGDDGAKENKDYLGAELKKRNFMHAKRQSSSKTTQVIQATIGHLR